MQPGVEHGRELPELAAVVPPFEVSERDVEPSSELLAFAMMLPSVEVGERGVEWQRAAQPRGSASAHRGRRPSVERGHELLDIAMVMSPVEVGERSVEPGRELRDLAVEFRTAESMRAE